MLSAKLSEPLLKKLFSSAIFVRLRSPLLVLDEPRIVGIKVAFFCLRVIDGYLVDKPVFFQNSVE